MSVKFPDYNRCIANLACSVLNHFGVTPPNPTLPEADTLLSGNYKNVVMILLDGMGVNVLEKHLSSDGFFRRNLVTEYSSVFPPTTVAAVTAAYSGKFPNQSAWLGWRGYFPEVDKNVIYFWNVDADTNEPLDFNVPYTFVPYENLCDKIRSVGTDAHYLAPFFEPHPSTYADFCKEIGNLCDGNRRKYVYAYWDEPDHTMHDNGVDSEDIGDILRNIEAETEKLAGSLADTLIMITADHGHINVRNDSIRDYPDITECLVRMPSMEARTLNLFVKEGMKAQFETVFNSHFGDSFMLLTKVEVMEKNLLGTGEDHEKLDGMLGDYLAVATGDVVLGNEMGEFNGSHAGITAEEMTIPLIAVGIS